MGKVTFPVTFLSAGTQTVTISYPGSNEFAAASGSVSVAVQPAATTTGVTAMIGTPARGASDTFTITVASSVTGLVPEGTVQLAVDSTAVATPLTLVNGVATYTTAFDSAGDHTVTATYSGSTELTSSSGSAAVKVPSPAFTLSSSSASLPHDGSGVATITVTPASSYTGVIHFAVSGSDLQNTCYSLPDLEVDGSEPVTASLKLTAGEKSCPAATALATLSKPRTEQHNDGILAAPILAFAGVLGFGLMRGRRRWQQWLMLILLVTGVAAAMTGCGGSSRLTRNGTYTLTVTGSDTKSNSIQNSVQVTVTVN